MTSNLPPKFLTKKEFEKIPQPDRSPICNSCKATPNCPSCGRFTKLVNTGSGKILAPIHHRYACFGCPKTQASVLFHDRIGY